MADSKTNINDMIVVLPQLHAIACVLRRDTSYAISVPHDKITKLR